MKISDIAKKIFTWTKENYTFIIGLTVITILSFATFHSDLTFLSKVAQRLASGNFNIYSGDYGIDGHQGSPIMPPLILLIDGFFFLIIKTLKIINSDFGFMSATIWQTFALKSRYILVFILSYPLIKQVAFKFTKDKSQSIIIANLWITSPILLFLPFTQGNNDIYPAVFTLIFLFFVFKEKYLPAMIFLGLTAALKNYGVFLVLPVALILAEKDIRKSIGYLATAGIAFLLPSMLYLRHFLNFGQAGGEGLLMLETVISSKINFPIFPLAYFIIILYLFFSDNSELLKNNKKEVVVFYSLLVLSLFFILSFYIPQWFLWVLPFFVFTVYKNKRLFYLYLILTSIFLFSLITNWSNNIDLNLFKPLIPALSPGTKIFPGYNSVILTSLINTLFSSVFIIFIYFSAKDLKKKENLPKKYVWLNVLPLAIYLLIMLLLSFPTLNSSKTYALEQTKITQELENTASRKILDLDKTEITKLAVLINTDYKNESYAPTTADPGISLPYNLEAVGENTYMVIKFNDNNLHKPQLFWKNGNDFDFSEKKSLRNFINYKDQIYYVKLSKPFYEDSNMKQLRLDPAEDTSNFDIDYIKILKLN